MSYKILSLNGATGYSFPVESLEEAMKLKIDVIADDCGSMDAGPYYLGAGISAFKATSIKRDFSLMLKAAIKQNCPLILGSCGMSGDTPHLNLMVDIVKEVMEEEGIKDVKIALISSHVDPSVIAEELHNLKPLGKMPQLTGEIIEKSRIVASMGIAPFITALNEGAQIILAGRSCDVAIFASDPVRKGMSAGLAYQTGHILECGAIACVPGSASDCLVAEFRDDGTVVFTPPNKSRKATPYSIAAHSLYEESHPSLQYYPEGVLVMKDTEYFPVPPDSAGIRNVTFVNRPLSIKLEGSMYNGKRIVSYLSLKEISNTDEPFINEYLVYGVNGVEKSVVPAGEEEIGILITVRGESEADVAALASITKGYMLHFGYPGRITTAGNVSFPISPIEIVHKEKDGSYVGLVICGTREPLFIKKMDFIFDKVIELTESQYPELYKRCKIEFLVSDKKHPMMFLDTVGNTEEEAEKLHKGALKKAEQYMDLSRPSYVNINAGNTYIWSIYHIWDNEEAIKKHLFPIKLYNGSGKEWEFIKEISPRYEKTGLQNYEGSVDEDELDLITYEEHAVAPSGYKPLLEMVDVLRSKDAGINTITYDIFFKNEEYYRLALVSNMFIKDKIAEILAVPKEHIKGTYRSDSCYAIKISRYREMIAGTPGSPDVFGAQQHMKIEKMNIPVYKG